MKEYPTWLQGGDAEKYLTCSKKRVKDIPLGCGEGMWMIATYE